MLIDMLLCSKGAWYICSNWRIYRVSQKKGAKNIAWHSTSQCTYYEVQLSIVHLIIKS